LSQPHRDPDLLGIALAAANQIVLSPPPPPQFRGDQLLGVRLISLRQLNSVVVGALFPGSSRDKSRRAIGFAICPASPGVMQ
jgi:hypothetical protein